MNLFVKCYLYIAHQDQLEVATRETEVLVDLLHQLSFACEPDQH